MRFAVFGMEPLRASGAASGEQSTGAIPMSDVIYLALGLAVFGAFAGYAVLLKRL